MVKCDGPLKAISFDRIQGSELAIFICIIDRYRPDSGHNGDEGSAQQEWQKKDRGCRRALDPLQHRLKQPVNELLEDEYHGPGSQAHDDRLQNQAALFFAKSQSSEDISQGVKKRRHGITIAVGGWQSGFSPAKHLARWTLMVAAPAGGCGARFLILCSQRAWKT
jgi:hypothetical protein